MTKERMIVYLNTCKNKYPEDEMEEVINTAIEAINSKYIIVNKLVKAIEREKMELHKFSDDFNHHLWIMRGLQIAKRIVEGDNYEDFSPKKIETKKMKEMSNWRSII